MRAPYSRGQIEESRGKRRSGRGRAPLSPIGLPRTAGQGRFVLAAGGDVAGDRRTSMRIEPHVVEEGRHDDLDLVAGSLRGEEAAIAGLALRLGCVPRILGSINQSMGFPIGPEDLADLSQDTLALIWTKLPTFQGRGRLETWSYRFCFLEFMNRLRQKDRNAKVHGESLDTVSDVMPGPVPVSASEYERLHLSLGELGAPEAEIIRLKHFEGLTFDDIGAILEISPNTAKTRYYRGLAWLRQRLDATQSQGEEVAGGSEA